MDTFAFVQNEKRFAIAHVLLLLDFLPALSRILVNSEQIIILQTVAQLMQYTVLEI